MNLKLAAVFDQCKISDKYAFRILTAIAESLQQEISEFIIYKSYIHRYQQEFRENFFS